jgi:hypothetical protein
MSQVLACDRCCTAEGKVEAVRIWCGSQPDPSGNGSEDDFVIVDICDDCLFTFFKWSEVRRDYTLQPILAEKMRKFVAGIPEAHK